MWKQERPPGQRQQDGKGRAGKMGRQPPSMEMGGFDMKSELIQGRKVTPKKGQRFDNIC